MQPIKVIIISEPHSQTYGPDQRICVDGGSRCGAITTKHGQKKKHAQRIIRPSQPKTLYRPLPAISPRRPASQTPQPQSNLVDISSIEWVQGGRGYLLAGARAVERGDGGVEQRHVDGPTQIPQLLRRHGAPRRCARGARDHCLWKRAGGGLVRPKTVGEGSEVGERRGEAAEGGIPGGGGRIRARDFELFRRSHGV